LFLFLYFSYIDAAFASGCIVNTNSGLNFGEYNVIDSSPKDSESQIILTCDTFASPVITVEIGPSSTSNSINTRQMHHNLSSSQLDYNLFVDSARNQIWGDLTSGIPLVLTNINDNVSRQISVYGRIPSGQNPAAGQYSDSVTVTVLP
jgi:spore coat protein U-like protein